MSKYYMSGLISHTHNTKKTMNIKQKIIKKYQIVQKEKESTMTYLPRG